MGKIAHTSIGIELTQTEFESASNHTIGGSADLQVARPCFVLSADDTPAALKPQADIVCDGTNDQDDLETILATLTSVGGEIVLLPGNYNWNTIIIPAFATGRIKIKGYGAVISSVITDNSNLVTFSGNNDLLVFEGMYFQGNATTGNCIHRPSTVHSRLVLRGVKIGSFTRSGSYGLYSDTADWHVIIEGRCIFETNDSGAYIQPIYNAVIRDSTFRQNAAKQLYWNGGYGKISGNFFMEADAGSSSPLVTLADFLGELSGNKFDGKAAADSSQDMMLITQVTQTFGSQGVKVHGNGFEPGTSSTGYSVKITRAASDVEIDANRFINPSGLSPIRITSVTSSRVRDIKVGRNAWVGTKPIVDINDTTAQEVHVDFLKDASYDWKIENLAAAQTNSDMTYSNAVGAATLPNLGGKRSWPLGIEVSMDAAIPAGETLTIKVGADPATGDYLFTQDIVNADGATPSFIRHPWQLDIAGTLTGTFKVTVTSTNAGAWAARDIAVRVIMSQQWYYGNAIAP